MSKKCPAPPELVLGECDPESLQPDDCDLDVWQAAKVVNEAAWCIAEQGRCYPAYLCDKGKRSFGLCTSDAPCGVVVGPVPEVGAACCGSITTGVLYPSLFEDNGGCHTPFDVEFQVKLTWPCNWHPWLMTAEISRFQRLLASTVCCKWPETAAKNAKRPTARLVAMDDAPPGDECPSVTFTLALKQ